MARTRTAQDALNRWRLQLPMNARYAMDRDGRLWDARVEVTAADIKLDLTIVGAQMTNLAGYASPEPWDVQKVLDALVNAPADAVVLAAEVERLRRLLDDHDCVEQ